MVAPRSHLAPGSGQVEWVERKREREEEQWMEAGVVEVVGMAEVVDGAGVTRAGEVGGRVEAVEGVVGAEERGREE